MFYTDISIYVEGSSFLEWDPFNNPADARCFNAWSQRHPGFPTVASLGRVVVVKKDIYIYIYISGQIITTSADVTLNGGLIRELPQNPLNSGLGIIVIWPDIWLLIRFDDGWWGLMMVDDHDFHTYSDFPLSISIIQRSFFSLGRGDDFLPIVYISNINGGK